MTKERVDVLAYQQGLFDTREKAKRGVMAGLVINEKNGERYDKPGEKIETTVILSLKGEKLPYVSRGGLKLERALSSFAISSKGKVALDIGASTGGFTDVLLQHGANLVYAIDVGTNQLAWKLRQDSRVISMEQYNFRYATKADFTQGIPSLATIDVSFISLALVLPPLQELLPVSGDVIALIKPQFEAGRDQIGKKGIIREAAVHEAVIRKVTQEACAIGFTVEALDYSPIQGGHGNKEFLVHLIKETHPINKISDQIESCVEKSHMAFRDK